MRIIIISFQFCGNPSFFASDINDLQIEAMPG